MLPLAVPGRLAAAGVALTAAVLLTASAFDASLGMPTLLAASVVWLLVAAIKRESPWPALERVSCRSCRRWRRSSSSSKACAMPGLLALLTRLLNDAAAHSALAAALGAGTIVAFACNAMNNLPAGLIAIDMPIALALAPFGLWLQTAW